jgi:hypothetical protein
MESARERALTEALLLAAPQHQGGHSDTGRAIADVLDCGFPVRMPGLEKAATRLGFDPDQLWPWYAQQKAARGVTAEQ